MIKRLPEFVGALEGTQVTPNPGGAFLEAHMGLLGLYFATRPGRIFIIGNGGSSAVASHVANDLVKAGISAMALVDAPTLTCLANDLGYERAFAHQVKCHGRAGDTLVAVSSSGKSINILMGCEAAKAARMDIVTLSGFDHGNPLRQMGMLNFYVPSTNYGIVEMAHQFILHCATDIATMGEESK